MARKVPNFSGFTLEDIAKANAGNNNAINSTAKNKDQFIKQNENSNADIDIALRDAINSNAINSIAKLSTNKSEALNENSNANINITSKDVINNTAMNSIAENNITKEKNPLPKSKENSNADIDIALRDAINNTAINSIAKFSTSKPEALSENSNANANTAPKNVNQALFSRVRDYLYGLLGDNESVEVKLNEVIKNLNINPHSFYKYLQTLRETDFTVVKLRYSTEIRRRVS